MIDGEKAPHMIPSSTKVMMERMKGKRSAMTRSRRNCELGVVRAEIARNRTEPFLVLVDAGREGEDDDIYEEEEDVSGDLRPAYR